MRCWRNELAREIAFCGVTVLLRIFRGVRNNNSKGNKLPYGTPSRLYGYEEIIDDFKIDPTEPENIVVRSCRASLDPIPLFIANSCSSPEHQQASYRVLLSSLSDVVIQLNNMLSKRKADILYYQDRKSGRRRISLNERYYALLYLLFLRRTSGVGAASDLLSKRRLRAGRAVAAYLAADLLNLRKLRALVQCQVDNQVRSPHAGIRYVAEQVDRE